MAEEGLDELQKRIPWLSPYQIRVSGFRELAYITGTDTETYAPASVCQRHSKELPGWRNIISLDNPYTKLLIWSLSLPPGPSPSHQALVLHLRNVSLNHRPSLKIMSRSIGYSRALAVVSPAWAEVAGWLIYIRELFRELKARSRAPFHDKLFNTGIQNVLKCRRSMRFFSWFFPQILSSFNCTI